MGNFISSQILKPCEPSLLNRGEGGMGKQMSYGGTLRARVSSQCLKYAIRKDMGINESIRTAHMEDCVENILNHLVENKTITAEEMSLLGDEICTALNCRWERRTSFLDSMKEGNKKAKSKKEDDENSDGVAKEDDKKSPIVVATPAEVIAVVDAVINCDCPRVKDGKDNSKARSQATAKAAAKALNEMRISLDKALFGTMATAGELGSVDGAVEMSQFYSIDEYLPENDFISVTFSEGNTDEISDDDPFKACFENFADDRRLQHGAENLTDSWLNANIMYGHTAVDINDLQENLSSSMGKNKKIFDIPKDIILEEMQQCIGRYMQSFALTDPEAKQHSMSTHCLPGIIYIEAIKNGNLAYTDFSKVVRRSRDKEIMNGGIERILNFAKCNRMRNGEVNRYVILSTEYDEYEQMFADAGVNVLYSFNELQEVINKETKRLMV